MNRRFNYRIYPNDAQKAVFAINFGCARFVYNYFVGVNENKYKENKTFMFKDEMSKQLTIMKRIPEYEFLRIGSSVVEQQVIIHLDMALKDCGSKVKNRKDFPKFKSKRDKQNFSIVGDNTVFRIENNKLWLTKVKGLIDVRWSRSLPSKPSSLTITRSKLGNYYVSFVVEVEEEISTADKVIGIDLGIETFATTSEGVKYKLPNLTRHYNKVRRRQQDLTRKLKGSKNREKARVKLAKAHQTISDIREDFHNKTVSQLVNENQVIVVETLKVKQMMKNRQLARMIGRQGWNTFITKLNDKCSQRGRLIYPINQYIPTSQVCSSCNYKWGKLNLKVRSITCINCGTIHDRDVNAAINILNEYNRR